MSNKWILSVRTSLPNFCESEEDLVRDDRIFDSFEEGKAAFLETLKSYSFSENAMFDGNGQSKAFEEYFDVAKWDWLIENDPNDYDDDFQWSTLKGFCDAIRSALKGERADISSLNVFNMEWELMVTRENDTVCMRGVGEGPDNGVEPYIKMNTFEWSEQKPYFLYFDDLFGQDCSAELYMDLLPVE